MYSIKWSQEDLGCFQQDGFLSSGALLNDDEVEELREELDRVIVEQNRQDISQPVRIENINRNKGGSQAVWQIVNIWMASKAFARIMQNESLIQLSANLIGAKELRLWHDQIQYKPKLDGGVNMWHQDWPYWPILSEPHQITVWIPLDEADESNGCMSMIKGSHLWGNQSEFLHQLKSFDDLPNEFKGHKIERQLTPVKKGHVHFHHGLTWHGSHQNKSQRPRRAIAFHFMGEKTRYLPEGKHICQKLVSPHVKNGDKMEGEFFPKLFEASNEVSVAFI